MTERTCETCENKDICRYVKEICDKIKRIEALSDDGLLIVDMRCKRWRNGVHEKEISELGEKNKVLEERMKNVSLPVVPGSLYQPGNTNPSCCSEQGVLETGMMEKVRELHFCGPFLCGEVDKPKTPSHENHCF